MMSIEKQHPLMLAKKYLEDIDKNNNNNESRQKNPTRQFPKNGIS